MNQNKLLVIAFALILALPTLDSILHFSPVKDLSENRTPTSKPQFPKKISALKKFSQNFERFFDDNYGIRKTLIFTHSQIMYQIFGEASAESHALIGKDGWLYLSADKAILDTIGATIISDELINRGVENFEKNRKNLRSKNVNYILVIPADKGTIYPEFFPSYIKPVATHRIDKFLSALKEKYPDFPILDLRDTLRKAKELELIYHPTDTHWNPRGAYYGYVEIMKNLRIPAHSRADFINKEDTQKRGDIAKAMNVQITNLNYDLTPNFKENVQEGKLSQADLIELLVPNFKHGALRDATFFVNKNKNLPIAFIYHDSFFDNLMRFVNEHFSKTYYVYGPTCAINYETIRKYHPSIVIQEFTERRLEDVLNQCN